MKNVFYSFLVIFALFLTGCADAGTDQTVNAGETVTLDANASTPEYGGEIKKYRWKQVRCRNVPRVTLSDKRSVSPTFIAPNVTKKTKLTFRLKTVEKTNYRRRFRSYDFVHITVLPESNNTDTTPPVIILNGEANITLDINDTYIELGATATDDIDDNVSVEINGTVNTTIAGVYTIRYSAKDQAGNEATPLIRTVTVNAIENIAPTAVITADKPMIEDDIGPNLMEIPVGTTVHFSAEESNDTDGQIIEYSWENSSVEINDNKDSNYTFTFENTGVFDIKLIVTDDNNATGEKIVSVTVIDNNDTHTDGYTVSGTVTDLNGTTISGAKVTIGQHSTFTDANGTYSINDINTSNHISINVTHPNYLANSRIASVKNKNVISNIKLGAPKATLTFTSTEGATLSSNDGASVELPAGGYVDANGTAYTGNIKVKMSYYPITTQNGRATFPGSFEGIENNGSIFPIQSYGFMNVELTDPQGNPLNLDGNSTATLNFPKDNNIYFQPTTIPLWYYDKVQGYWVKDGVALRTTDYTHYVGTVTHFTAWNLDAKGPRARFTGCVEDANGSKISQANVIFRTPNWDSYTVKTDENGTISVYNLLANETISFIAYKKINGLQYAGTIEFYISEGEDKTLEQCLILLPDPDFVEPLIPHFMPPT